MNNSTPSPLHIFYVEDNAHDRMAFPISFKKYQVPYKITEYTDAEEVFELLRFDASTTE